MNSIVVHYKELALKGRNRPWFVQILNRNLRTRSLASVCASIRSVDGSDRDRGSAPGRRGSRSATGSAAYLESPTSRMPAGVHRTSMALAAAILGDARRPVRPSRFASARAASDKAVSVYVAPDRARGRRPHQGGQEDGAWTSTTRPSRFTSRCCPNQAFYFFGKEPGAGGLPTGHGGRRRLSAVGRDRFARRGVSDDAARLFRDC